MKKTFFTYLSGAAIGLLFYILTIVPCLNYYMNTVDVRPWMPSLMVAYIYWFIAPLFLIFGLVLARDFLAHPVKAYLAL